MSVEAMEPPLYDALVSRAAACQSQGMFRSITWPKPGAPPRR